MAGLDPVGSGKQEENPKSSWVGISQSKFGGETSQLSSLFFSFFEKALFLPVIGTVFRKFSVHLDCARVVIQRTPGGGGVGWELLARRQVLAALCLKKSPDLCAELFTAGNHPPL